MTSGKHYAEFTHVARSSGKQYGVVKADFQLAQARGGQATTTKSGWGTSCYSSSEEGMCEHNSKTVDWDGRTNLLQKDKIQIGMLLDMEAGTLSTGSNSGLWLQD